MAHYNLIVPGGTLYQGDMMAAATDAGKFDTLVLAAEEIPRLDFIFPKHVCVIDAGIDDAELSPKEAQIAEKAAGAVATDLRALRKVLVTCAMGRNRSGLISALALKHMGYSGPEAIKAVQLARPNALTNESFVRYLLLR